MTPEFEDLSEKSVSERIEIARSRWESLPAVVREVLLNAPKQPMYEVLRKLGVEAGPTRAVEWAYRTKDGGVVVTVWHDQIKEDQNGLYYYIPTSKWRRSGVQQQRAEQMRELLAVNSGKAVKAMLLKHEWDSHNTQFAKIAAADIRSWRLEKLSESEFLLRRGTKSSGSGSV